MRYLSGAEPAELQGTALVRLDFNTQDDWRMRAVLPTLKLLLRRADKVVIVSHRGRPPILAGSGKREAGRARRKLSLRRDATRLGKLLSRKVIFIPHFDFSKIRRTIERAPRRSVFLLENIRFLKGESTPRPELAKQLASLADYYVNDAFAVNHHSADSVSGMERFLPGYAGLELERELRILGEVLRRPRKPLVFVIGGAKAQDKLGVIKHFLRRADYFLLGGASANTLLRLRGVPVGASAVEEDPRVVRELQKIVRSPKIVLPVDWRSEKRRGKGREKAGGKTEEVILDIGPRTVKLYGGILKRARTIVWSGPLGLIEKPKFAQGSLAAAKTIAANLRALSLAGGGETVAFLRKHRLDRKFDFISTGGGAFLDFLAGEKLPGIEALKRSNR